MCTVYLFYYFFLRIFFLHWFIFSFFALNMLKISCLVKNEDKVLVDGQPEDCDLEAASEAIISTARTRL